MIIYIPFLKGVDIMTDYELKAEISDRALSKAILLQALEIEQEQGLEAAKPYYDILLNTLGIYFHTIPKVKKFMLNRIDSAFDYFEDFESPDYIVYLQSLINAHEADLLKYAAYEEYKLHNNQKSVDYIKNYSRYKKDLEVLNIELKSAQDRLQAILNKKTR